MRLEELRAVWRQNLDQPAGKGELDLVARLVKQLTLDFEETIRRRDRNETIATLFLIVFFVLAGIFAPNPICKLGCGITVGGSCLILFKLRRARGAGGPPSPLLPLAEFLAREREHVVRQVRLLSNILWWYILPLLAGVNLIFASLAPWRWSIGYFVGTVLLGIYLWRLNQRAIRENLQPLLDEIDRVERQLSLAETPIEDSASD